MLYRLCIFAAFLAVFLIAEMHFDVFGREGLYPIALFAGRVALAGFLAAGPTLYWLHIRPPKPPSQRKL